MTTPQPKITTNALAVELPGLLAERGLSLRALADRIGVDHAHLSRAMRGVGGKTIAGDLAGRIAFALDLPADYFPEYREAIVIERVQSDSRLRDRLYGEVGRTGAKRTRRSRSV